MIALALGLIAMVGPIISRMSAMQLAVALLACAAIVCGAVFLVPQNALDRFMSDGTELTEGTMTHRTQLWSAGMEVFREHPFVGVGSGAYGSAIQSIVDVDLIGHNTFISVLVELGVVGALLFAAIFRLWYLWSCGCHILKSACGWRCWRPGRSVCARSVGNIAKLPGFFSGF